MGRRHVVKNLDGVQFDFVINAIIGGLTDREISLAFEQQFEKPLAKSSLNRWRKSAGNELADRYNLARYQARQLLTDLKQEDQDKYQVVIRNIEDRLLTATREVIATDPVKLLKIRQEEERRRLREKELELK
jgi:ABC-type tungstate transport system permease subunit